MIGMGAETPRTALPLSEKLFDGISVVECNLSEEEILALMSDVENTRARMRQAVADLQAAAFDEHGEHSSTLHAAPPPAPTESYTGRCNNVAPAWRKLGHRYVQPTLLHSLRFALRAPPSGDSKRDMRASLDCMSLDDTIERDPVLCDVYIHRGKVDRRMSPFHFSSEVHRRVNSTNDPFRVAIDSLSDFVDYNTAAAHLHTVAADYHTTNIKVRARPRSKLPPMSESPAVTSGPPRDF